MAPKPNSTSKKDPGKRAYSAIGRTIKKAPKSNTPSYTADEARRLKSGGSYIDKKTKQVKQFAKQYKA